MIGTLGLSLRLTGRDWRAGELRLLLAALLIAVAGLSAVGFFVDRMQRALELQARQLLGADLVIASDAPLSPEVARRARAAGLAVAETVTFPSMVLVEGRAQLASVKAVSANYPLRGALRVAEAPNAPDAPIERAPARGEAWLDAQLVQGLGLRTGGRLQLGDAAFRLDRVITLEPDRGASFVNFAPRAMIPLEDLPATGLVQPASRITWRVLVAGDDAQALAAFKAWVEPALGRGQRLESLQAGRPELRATLERAERFLALVALLTALIAAVAIALACRRFAERHLDGCAVMRSMGLGQRRLAALLLLELLWVGLAGGLAGAALGWGVHFVLVQAIAPLLQLPLPWPSAWPLVQALAAGLVLVLGFGGWPFLRLAGVPPLRVLRRELGAGGGSAWVAVGLATVAFSALLVWFARDLKLAAIALGGFAGGAVVFVLASWGAVRAIGPLRRLLGGAAASPALRLALAAWSRRQGAAVTQTVALSVGLMALMLLTITRTELLESWRKASPADAPNRFVINIQPDQRDAVEQMLAQSGVRGAELYPMIRGRLVEVNGRPVRPEDFAGDRAQRLVDREFNLSYATQPAAHNPVVAGRWFAADAAEVSAEEGILATLGLKLGDAITFDVAGEPVTARITSVRKVSWDSMKVNFFMVLSPKLLGSAPQTLITAYHQPAGSDADQQLVRRFPNLTVFDTGNIVRQVQAMLEQVVRAVQFLFVLTLIAGMIVLYGALAASRDERVREAGLMRALGASRAQLSSAQVWELVLSGGLAGLLSSAGAVAVGATLATQVFQFEYAINLWAIPLGVAVGAVISVVAGWFGLRAVLATPPLVTLRNA